MAIVHWAEATHANKGCQMRSCGHQKGCVFMEVAWEGCWVWAVSSAKYNIAVPIQTPVYADLQALRWIEQMPWVLSQLCNEKLQWCGLCLNSSFGRASHTACCFASHTYQRAEIFKWLLWCLFAMCLNKYPICKICSNGAWKLNVQLHVLLTQGFSAYYGSGHLTSKFY